MSNSYSSLLSSKTVSGLEMTPYDMQEWEGFTKWLSVNKEENWEMMGQALVINPTNIAFNWLW